MLYINNDKPPECGPLKAMSGLEAQRVTNVVTLRRHHKLEDRLLMSGDDPVKINIFDPKRSKFLEKNSNGINTIKGLTEISKLADYRLIASIASTNALNKSIKANLVGINFLNS